MLNLRLVQRGLRFFYGHFAVVDSDFTQQLSLAHLFSSLNGTPHHFPRDLRSDVNNPLGFGSASQNHALITGLGIFKLDPDAGKRNVGGLRIYRRLT